MTVLNDADRALLLRIAETEGIKAAEAAADRLYARHDELTASRTFAAGIRQPAKATTARGASIELPAAIELAAAELQERGIPAAEAYRLLALKPEATIEELRPRIEARREALLGEANLAESEAFRQSPEGRLEEGRRLRREEAERTEKAAAARALLLAQDPALDSDLSNLTDDEVLDLSGIQPSERRQRHDFEQTPEAWAEHEAAQPEPWGTTPTTTEGASQ